MTPVKYIIALYTLLLLITSSCAHKFINSPINNNRIDYSEKVTIELNDCDYYYRCIYRHKDTLEKAYYSKPSDDSNYKITDVEYLILNKKLNSFMIISYIPIRNRGHQKQISNDKYAKVNYYMDTYLKDYKDSINLYYLSNFFYGRLTKDSLILERKGSGKRNSMHINYTITDSVFSFKTIYYPNREPHVANLNEVFNPDLMKFRKTIIKGFKMHGINGRNVGVEPVITSCYFKRSLPNYVKSKKNLILFNYKQPVNNYNHFFFKEVADRLNYVYPLK